MGMSIPARLVSKETRLLVVVVGTWSVIIPDMGTIRIRILVSMAIHSKTLMSPAMILTAAALILQVIVESRTVDVKLVTPVHLVQILANAAP